MVLKNGLENHLDNHLEWVKSMQKRSLDDIDNDENQQVGVQHIYYGGPYGFYGYAGSFLPDVLESIKQHDHVSVRFYLLTSFESCIYVDDFSSRSIW